MRRPAPRAATTRAPSPARRTAVPPPRRARPMPRRTAPARRPSLTRRPSTRPECTRRPPPGRSATMRIHGDGPSRSGRRRGGSGRREKVARGKRRDPRQRRLPRERGHRLEARLLRALRRHGPRARRRRLRRLHVRAHVHDHLHVPRQFRPGRSDPGRGPRPRGARRPLRERPRAEDAPRGARRRARAAGLALDGRRHGDARGERSPRSRRHDRGRPGDALRGLPGARPDGLHPGRPRDAALRDRGRRDRGAPRWAPTSSSSRSCISRARWSRWPWRSGSSSGTSYGRGSAWTRAAGARSWPWRRPWGSRGCSRRFSSASTR